MSAESLRERLARLRREAPTPPASPAPAQELRTRLARREQRLPARAESEAPARSLAFGPPERLEPGGLVPARITRCALDSRHGRVALRDALGGEVTRLAAEARDERIAGLDLARAVFLDTETTGLSGGAGTYVWLVGLGRFRADAFEVWQGFLAGPADEAALLTETAARIADASFVVSFFGKSFDRHRLEDKMRVHGVPPPFAERPHLDLYWPLRRRHQGRFGDCRLRTLEHELCGVEREDDLPGSFAPAAWFDFLHGRPHRLEGVFRHNLDDVKSLVTLLVELGRLPAAR